MASGKSLFSSIYLVSKVASALLNAISIAFFTRLATSAVFGEYLVGFAFGFIAYGLVVQWLLGAHFGQQSRQHAARIANAAVVLTGVSLAVGLVMIATGALAGIVPAEIAWECAFLLVGISVYFIANEIGRSQLLVGPVTFAAFLRALFTLLFGCLALWQFNSAPMLLVAIAIGHILSVVPIVLGLRGTIWGSGFAWPERADYVQLWRYGWPLIIAGGASAVAVSIDRILLSHYFGPEMVGPYGATLDFIKQSFIIVGETVAVSYVSLAKFFHGEGQGTKSHATLEKASLTIAFLAVFGIAFFLLLGDDLFRLLLGAGYHEALSLVPWLAAANALLMLRSYYFAQVIYFTNTARLELISMVVAMAVAVVLGLWLIPAYGIYGATASFGVAQLAALLVFFVSAETRATMPVNGAHTGFLLSVGFVVVVLGEVVRFTTDGMVTVALNLAILSVASAWLLLKWDMFDARTIWGRFVRMFQAAPQG